MHLVLFRDRPDAVETHIPEVIVAGAPVTRFAVHDTSGDGRLSTGVWHAGIGAWRVAYTEWEFCHVIAGHARLHEDGADPVEIGPGDSFTVQPGFAGVWEMIVPMTKHFVILDPPSDQ